VRDCTLSKHPLQGKRVHCSRKGESRPRCGHSPNPVWFLPEQEFRSAEACSALLKMLSKAHIWNRSLEESSLLAVRSLRRYRNGMRVRSLKLALVQMNSTVGALTQNSRRIVDALKYARAQGADIVAFPELALSGYPPEDLLLAPRFLRDCRRTLETLVEHTHGLTAVIGFPLWDEDPYNAAAILHDGQWVGNAVKHFLPNYGVFDEDRYFQRGRGVTVIERRGIRVGINICEDIWYPEGPPAWQALHGNAEILLNLSASPFERGKRQRRRQMLETRASDCNALVAFVNAVGGQDELVFDGGSLICNARGVTQIEADVFTEGILVRDCVIDSVQSNRLQDPRRRKSRREAVSEGVGIVRHLLAEPQSPQEQAADSVAPADSVTLSPLRSPDRWKETLPLVERSEEAEVYAALVMGVRDYVSKNGFERVVLGLSGGIDSALTAAIAVDALGAERVQGLTMPSRFSSQGTQVDALELARNLGIACPVLSIEPAFKALMETLKPVFGEKAWNEAEENLQARIRGTLLMAVSNKRGPLVLTTGNKSEISVGYSTLYGDMAGGFNVLKDVFKTLVYRLAWYRQGLGPSIPESTITRAPSAELRADQTDQDSLPDYAILDAILEAYVEEDIGPDEIVARGFDVAMVHRVLKLVDASEFKRRQAPPGVKISNRAFGRDRRFPITNRYRPGE
jgi:NAD+ synthase (glutamine-hydrolysing)